MLFGWVSLKKPPQISRVQSPVGFYIVMPTESKDLVSSKIKSKKKTLRKKKRVPERIYRLRDLIGLSSVLKNRDN